MTICGIIYFMSRADVVGFVPEELRSTMSQQLPDWAIADRNPSLRMFTGIYHSDDAFRSGHSTAENADDLGEPYVQLFNAVADLGQISYRPDAYIQTDLVQGQASDIGRILGWHTDEALHYRRLVVCDKFGTLYGSQGAPQITPDYGILRFVDEALHKPNLGPFGVTKTRLQVTLMPKSNNAIRKNKISMF